MNWNIPRVTVTVTVAVLALVLAAFSTGSGWTQAPQGPAAGALPASTVAKAQGVDRPKDTRAFTRPEDRGEDLSALALPELAARLSASKDKAELRKAAKAIGDRCTSGSLALADPDRKKVDEAVAAYLAQAKSPDSNERTEARDQIERLWTAAAPTLLENVGNPDATIAELAIKSLILMRNESIVKALAEKARSSGDERTRGRARFALMKMQEQRTSLIPGRQCLDEAASKRLYDDVVAPALAQLPQGGQ